MRSQEILDNWPFPYRKHSDADPVGILEESMLSADERVTRRTKAAQEYDSNWEADWVEEYDTDVSNDIDVKITPDDIVHPQNEYELHDNVAIDIVRYVRSNTVRNEQQFLLLALAYVSGLSADPDSYISSVTIGTSSSGKSHLKDKVDTLFINCDVMDASTGSDKALIYDDDWDSADIISMGELNQPSSEMLEFMKRAHGGDNEVVIRSTRGNPSSGFDTKTIRKDSKSYHFTYAQFDADFEFWNRLLKIPVHESESKNRAVGRLVFGHGDVNIQTDGTDDNDTWYGYEFDDGTERLQAHILDVKRDAPPYVVIPNGSDKFDWDAWPVISPIFKHSRSESNRVYKMVRNLIKASARLNYKNRDTIDYRHVNTDTAGGHDVDHATATVAAPQDVANVLRCLDVLRATTHEIGPRKRAVVRAIHAQADEDKTVSGLDPIIEFLDDSDASVVNLNELENIIDDLENDHLVSINGSEITVRNWDALGEPNITPIADKLEDCVDPIRGGPFMEQWHEYRRDALTTADDLLNTPSVSSDGVDVSTATIEDYGSDINAALSDDTSLNATEQFIAGQIATTVNDVRVSDMTDMPVEAFLGIVDPTTGNTSYDTLSGTVLDPDHEIWNRKVTTTTDARRVVQDVIRTLTVNNILTVDEVHSTTGDDKPEEVTLTIEL